MAEKISENYKTLLKKFKHSLEILLFITLLSDCFLSYMIGAYYFLFPLSLLIAFIPGILNITFYIIIRKGFYSYESFFPSKSFFIINSIVNILTTTLYLATANHWIVWSIIVANLFVIIYCVVIFVNLTNGYKTYQHHREEKEKLENIQVTYLKDMIQGKTRLNILEMAQKLEMDVSQIYTYIFDWADQFKFQIDADDIILNQETLLPFLQSLDAQFSEWEKIKEKKKI